MDSMDKNPNQVIHVRGDSDSELQALFEVLNHTDGNGSLATAPTNRPFRDRKLPASFFKPPEPQKGNHSREGSADSTTCNSVGNNFSPHSALKPGLAIVHPRAHSSPASLQQTLGAPPGPHMSVPYDQITDQETDLPPGWEMAKTPNGQRYFLNHVDQTTTWHDPRKSVSTTALNQPTINQQQLLNTKGLGPLPPGWEQATTPDGEPYFINHMEKATSWFDPRLPAHLQRPSVRMGPPLPPPGHSSIAQQLQRQSVSPADRQRQLQFQKLQMEKERLRQRQEEITRQLMLCSNTIAEETTTTVTTSQSSDLPSVTTTSVDPFLNQGGQNSDFHTRQESADSGLGGMGYSLPRTPEDFLSNVDEMDSQDGGPKLQQQHNQQLDIVDIPTNMDIGSIGDNDVSNMDSDDLVPSLQEDLNTDLISDVETYLIGNRVENLLTWL